jgi:hypothetical protein
LVILLASYSIGQHFPIGLETLQIVFQLKGKLPIQRKVSKDNGSKPVNFYNWPIILRLLLFMLTKKPLPLLSP